MSSSTNQENATDANNSAAARAIVSPPVYNTTHASGGPSEDLARDLFSGRDDEIDVEDIDSRHICPLSREPPFQGVHFDVPDSNGGISEQVFERSDLYRWIATPGNLNARRNVSHPFNQQFVSRSVAWDLVRPVSEELQATLHRERVALNYPLEDDNPLTDVDRARYAETMRASVDRFVLLFFGFFYFVCIFSLLRYLFFIASVIDRSEVIAGDDLSSDDSDSVIEMFAIPPLARQPVERQQERPSSTSTTNTSRSTTTSTSNNTSQSASTTTTANASTAGSTTNRERTRRSALGGFVFTSNGRSGIRSANHAAGIIGLLQLAGAHPSGWEGTLGHNQRTQWFNENVDAFFQADGPLGVFNQVSPLVLLRHFSAAQNQARALFDRRHSNDQSGADNEDIPPWAQQFFRVFESQQNLPSASAQAAAIRSERRSVVSSLTGRQAPLGNSHGQGPVQLRTETSRNAGSAGMRQMSVGDYNVEVVGDDAMNDRIDEDSLLVEGVDDTADVRPARRRRTNSGVRRRNANIDFGAGRNDPAARFHHVTQAFASLDALTHAVAQSFSAAPTRSLIDVAIDFDRATEMLIRARERNDTVGIAFYEAIRQQYVDEQAAIVSGNVQQDE